MTPAERDALVDAIAPLLGLEVDAPPAYVRALAGSCVDRLLDAVRPAAMTRWVRDGDRPEPIPLGEPVTSRALLSIRHEWLRGVTSDAVVVHAHNVTCPWCREPA